MNRRFVTVALHSILLAMLLPGGARAEALLNLEGGFVFPEYNDVRIPNDTGTLLSLTDDLTSDPTVYARLQFSYRFAEKHSLTLLAAPLSIDATGRVDEEIVYNETVFPADTPLEARYVFNSYRLTYRYDFYRGERFAFGLGLTAKIRDAEISLKGGGLEGAYDNVGFVPLLNFRLMWKFYGDFSLLFAGDAAGASQGRAEDILAAVTYQTTPRTGVYLGYRFLEGGADVADVYSFAMFSYLAAGITVAL